MVKSAGCGERLKKRTAGEPPKDHAQEEITFRYLLKSLVTELRFRPGSTVNLFNWRMAAFSVEMLTYEYVVSPTCRNRRYQCCFSAFPLPVCAVSWFVFRHVCLSGRRGSAWSATIFTQASPQRFPAAWRWVPRVVPAETREIKHKPGTNSTLTGIAQRDKPRSSAWFSNLCLVSRKHPARASAMIQPDKRWRQIPLASFHDLHVRFFIAVISSSAEKVFTPAANLGAGCGLLQNIHKRQHQ